MKELRYEKKREIVFNISMDFIDRCIRMEKWVNIEASSLF